MRKETILNQNECPYNGIACQIGKRKEKEARFVKLVFVFVVCCIPTKANTKIMNTNKFNK